MAALKRIRCQIGPPEKGTVAVTASAATSDSIHLSLGPTVLAWANKPGCEDSSGRHGSTARNAYSYMRVLEIGIYLDRGLMYGRSVSESEVSSSLRLRYQTGDEELFELEWNSVARSATLDDCAHGPLGFDSASKLFSYFSSNIAFLLHPIASSKIPRNQSETMLPSPVSTPWLHRGITVVTV